MMALRRWRPSGFAIVLPSLVPALLLVSVVVGLAAQVAMFFQEHTVRGALQVSYWSELSYLCAYPCLLLGVGVLIWYAPDRPPRHVVLDSLMTVAAVLPFSWFFIIGPSIRHDEAGAKLGFLYAVYGLVLLFGVLLLSAEWRHQSHHRPTVLLAMGLLIIAIGGSPHAYRIANHTDAFGPNLDVVRTIGFLMVAGATFVMYRVRREKRPPSASSGTLLSAHALERGMPQLWRYLLPYALIPGIGALLVWTAHAGVDWHIETGVYLSAAVFIEFALVHQVLAYRGLIAYASKSARLERIVGADPITGLPNHRAMVSMLDREVEHCRRYRRPCAVLFIDIDHFKTLNDTFGHSAGDAALCEFAGMVRAALRTSDSLGRWGGEEFVALLPESGSDAALNVAERVRTSVEEHVFWAIGGAHLTCSVGVALLPDDADGRAELLERADGAMYAAKRLGRNQVRMATDGAERTHGTEQAAARDENALAGVVEAMARSLRAGDQSAGQHACDAANMAECLAIAIGLEPSGASIIRYASRLHDLGNVAIPDRVFQKPGPLTEDEWILVRTHPSVGAAMVSRMPILQPLVPMIRHHHERWDGRGYPDGKIEQSIPLGARILSVVDAFSAMTTHRPYAPARSATEALAELRRCSGTQFDPQVVDALAQMLCSDTAQDEQSIFA